MDGGDTKDDTTKGAVDDEKKPATTTVDTKDPETKAVASNGSAIAKDENGDTKHDKSASAATATSTSTPPKDEKTSVEKPARKKKGKKKNLWRFLNSCFTSSVLEDSGTEKTKLTPKASKSKKSSASPNVASKEDEKPKNKSAGPSPETAPSISSSMGPALTLNTKPATPSRRSSAIVNGDGDVVIPPASGHDLLPKAETAGVTSGAVQAPGSTGSEEDSEGSVTDEGGHRQLEDEDDEERLIMNGGNGIPIGPVSPSAFTSWVWLMQFIGWEGSSIITPHGTLT
jgi:RNA polymerase II subunit A small phosphatase-like protein